MKYYWLIPLCLLPHICHGTIAAEDTTESKTLHEITVVADNQRTTAGVSTYIPGKHQKNAAQGGVPLLGLMGIPQLDVDLATLGVKTTAGQPVTIFIDYNEATTQDLEAMKTTDVKRVEFYNYPADARFKGAAHVVNFVMQKYEYGGYTKLKAEKQFSVNRTMASVYSKIAYKKMIYDIYADENYITDRHSGSDRSEQFHFPDYNGNDPMDITRNSFTEASRYRNNLNNISLRALYSASNIQISNRANLNIGNTPVNEQTNRLTYSPEIFESAMSRQKVSSKNITAAYKGDLFLNLSSKTSVQTAVSYNYGHNTSDSYYSSAPDFSITNNAKEESHDVHLNPRFSYRIDNHSNLMLFGSAVWRHNKIDYYGNSPSTQKYNVSAYFAGAHYDLIFDKVQAGGEIGWAWERNRISGVSLDDNFPQVNVYANYMPAQRHLLTFSWNYGKDVPDASQKSPNMLRQDELMWYTGSPNLKDYKYMNTTLTYTWLPNNRWQLSATGGMFNFKDRCVTIYTPDAPGGMMLRKYVNGGNYDAFMLNVNATAKLMGGKLALTFVPQFWHYRTTGAYSHNINDFNGRMQATYYLNELYFVGSYTFKRKYPATQAEYIEKVPEQYMIQVGWGNGAWNLSATAYNFLRSSWVGAERNLKSRYYGFSLRQYSTAAHMRFAVATTYTFGYGKKVDRYNEVDKGEFSKSAILK